MSIPVPLRPSDQKSFSAAELADIRQTTRFTPSEISALRALAHAHDRSVSWEIREAVKAYLQAKGMTSSDNVRPRLPELLDSA